MWWVLWALVPASALCLDLRWPSPGRSAVYPIDWHPNRACAELLHNFSMAAGAFQNCTIQHSVPPLVCTNCFEQFAWLEREYAELRQSEKRVQGGKLCSDVVFDSYLVSFVYEIYTGLKEKIWLQSKCYSCIAFPTTPGASPYTNHTIEYEELLLAFRLCVLNVSGESYMKNASAVCNDCLHEYSDLYAFYWKVYIDPDIEFCLDMEATMNDTIHLWRQRLGCILPKVPSRMKQAFLVTFICCALLLATVAFYAGSYIQGERQQRQLIKYSNLNPDERTPIASAVSEGPHSSNYLSIND